MAVEINGQPKLKVHENGGVSVGSGNVLYTHGLIVEGNMDIGGNIHKNQKLTISSYSEIEFLVGASRLQITDNGVVLNGSHIDITGDIRCVMQSPETSVSGDLQLDLDGGTTIINKGGLPTARLYDQVQVNQGSVGAISSGSATVLMGG